MTNQFSISKFMGEFGINISRVTLPFRAGLELTGIWKDVTELVLTIEQAMKDGKIDPSERRTLGAKGIRMALDKIGVIITDDQAGAFIDIVVAILNKYGILKKGEKK